MNLRCAEYHTVTPPGNLAFERHYDHGSLITIDIMLSDSSSFAGGAFATSEPGDYLLQHPFEKGDLLLFLSHKYHCVSPVESGTPGLPVAEVLPRTATALARRERERHRRPSGCAAWGSGDSGRRARVPSPSCGSAPANPRTGGVTATARRPDAPHGRRLSCSRAAASARAVKRASRIRHDRVTSSPGPSGPSGRAPQAALRLRRARAPPRSSSASLSIAGAAAARCPRRARIRRAAP